MYSAKQQFSGRKWMMKIKIKGSCFRMMAINYVYLYHNLFGESVLSIWTNNDKVHLKQIAYNIIHIYESSSLTGNFLLKFLISPLLGTLFINFLLPFFKLDYLISQSIGACICWKSYFLLHCVTITSEKSTHRSINKLISF